MGEHASRRARAGHAYYGHHDVRLRRGISPPRESPGDHPADSGRSGGFTAFIPWIFAPENTPLGKKIPEATAFDYLKTLAISRLYLDNIDHIQSSWLTPGIKICQVGLQFGADDVGSILIEENVVYAAGVRNRTNEEELRRIITD